MLRKANQNDLVSIVNIEKSVLVSSLELDFYDNEINLNPFSNIFVVEENNKVVGFISTRVYDFSIEILNFGVLEEFQNKGFGRLLINHLFDIAINDDLENITLEVRESNDKALKFYYKHGFKLSHVKKNYYKNENGLFLIKEFKI